MSKVDKTRCGGRWTEARYRSFIKSNLRKGSTRWAPAQDALKDAEVGRKINKKTSRLAMHYLCAHCKDEFPRKEVSIDHIAPVIPVDVPWPGWEVVIDRMFVEKEGFQILCDCCHTVKSNNETAQRAELKRKLKESN